MLAGQEVWFDQKDIPPTVEWLAEVHLGIDSANNFLFLLSHASITSGPCAQELARAIASGKRIIPICYQKPDPGIKIDPAISDRNYIFLRDTDDFDAAVKTLVAAMHTDFDWVHAHTRLHVRAQEWQTRNRDSSYLLGGSDLKDAETWLARAAGQPIQPTPLQQEYLIASRLAATRRSRIVVAVLASFTIVAIALAIYAFTQRNVANTQRDQANQARKLADLNATEARLQRDNANTQRIEAEHQARIATSGFLAATAISLRETRLDLASLLSLEASRLENTLEARNALLTTFQTVPQLAAYRRTSDPTGFVNAISFSADGKLVAIGSEHGAVELRDAKTWRPLWIKPNPQRHVLSLALNPDGQTLAIAFLYSTVELWRTAGSSPLVLSSSLPGQPAHPSCVAFNRNGALLAAGGDSGVQVWQMPSISPLRTGRGSGLRAFDLAFSPSDPHLLAYGSRLEDALTGALLGEMPNADGHIAFTHDGTLIATEKDNSIAIWKLSNTTANTTAASIHAALQSTIPTVDSGVIMGLAFRPGGAGLVAASSHGAMPEWDPVSGQFLALFPSSLNVNIHAIAFNPATQQLFSGHTGGSILVWDSHSLAVPKLSPDALESDPSDNQSDESDSGLTATITPKGIRIQPPHASAFYLPDSPPLAEKVVVSPDGRFAAASSSRGDAHSRRLWEISAGTAKVIPFAAADTGTFDLAFNPAGNLLATVGRGGLDLWNLKDGSLAGAWVDPSHVVSRLAFSPDGATIALGIYGGEVLLVDTATQHILGLPIQPYLDDAFTAPAVAFSDDGKQLAFTDKDKKTWLWDANPADWAARACQVANRNLSLIEWQRYMGAAPYRRTCPQFPDGDGVFSK